MKRKNSKHIDKRLIVSIVVIVALAAVAAIIFAPRSTADSSGLPAFARSTEPIKEAYIFARDNPEKAEGIRCYCGCMQSAHNGRIHTRGLLDCFVKEDNTSFDSHGANCKMCVDDLLEIKKLYAEGKTKGEITVLQDLKHANDPKLPGMKN